jgi:hypothetical protein
MFYLSGGEFDYKHLKIPRKPSWTRTMTADEVDRRETDNFLDWRREISQMEEKFPTMKVMSGVSHQYMNTYSFSTI